ncbi:MAG: Amuc_1100 family pilus-like protein [Lacunisphaera sp.]|nr:Amuc_1100 family pilus-like protein [Lacunisphaera sp.]
MNRFTNISRSGAALCLFGVMLATEGWLWAQARQQSIRELTRLEQSKQERDRLARQSPALSEENEQAIAGDLANTRQVFAALRAALQGREGDASGSTPDKPLELYFNIATFIEKTRALARRAEVRVKPDECFGFSAHVNEGPEADLVPAVFRQRVSAQYLVEALIEAHPRSLTTLQRERPRPLLQRTLPAPAGVAGDFFELDPALSLREAGRIDSDAFRVEFTGQTAALRNFLSALANFPLPLIVRDLEVAALPGEELSALGAAPPAASVPIPVVARNISKFAVVVEFIRLVPESTP